MLILESTEYAVKLKNQKLKLEYDSKLFAHILRFL